MSENKTAPAPEPKKEPVNEGLAKIQAIVKAWPNDHPDEKILFGYGDHRITVADIKQAAKAKA